MSAVVDLREHYKEVRRRLWQEKPVTKKPQVLEEPVVVDLPKWPFVIQLRSWKTIVLEVAAEYNLPITDLLSIRRQKKLVEARHKCMYRMRMETTLSYPQIGEKLGGRDHTTVLHGVRSYAAKHGLPQP